MLKGRKRRAFYVYRHVCPETGNLLYIGKGTRARAWTYGTTGRPSVYGHRSKQHCLYLTKLESRGYSAADWVKIYKQGLTHKEALSIEANLLIKFAPLFNKTPDKRAAKLSKNNILRALAMRKKGWYYSRIAAKLRVSAMTVHRAVNKQTKVYLKYY